VRGEIETCASAKDNKINFRVHAELENIKSAGEKDEKKYTILASNGPRMLGNMFHQSRPKAQQFCDCQPG
jgi:hypothetical protein